MKKMMILVMVVGGFWVGQVWADMERVSCPTSPGQKTELSQSSTKASG